MERVLILTYFFPPCNLTAAERSWGWAKYLPEHGYEPVVVTRAWDEDIGRQEDLAKSAGAGVSVEKGEGYQLHYLPYRPNLRDRLFTNGTAPLVRKMLTGSELILQNYFSWAVPYQNLYEYTCDLLEKNQDIRKLIVSANPYPLFQFAYLLSKRFPRLKWVADYRGDWSTKQLNKGKGVLWNLLRKLESRSEKKWIKQATSLISTSQQLTDRISLFTGKQGITVPEGWLEEDFEERILPPRADTFVITYSGFLFEEQKIERFLQAFKEAVDHFEGRIQLKIRFIGIDFHPPSAKRVRDCMGVYYRNLEMHAQVPRAEQIMLERRSDLMLMLPADEQKGNPAAKIYRYVGARRPVLCFPGDGDFIEEILQETGLGIVCNDVLEVYDRLYEMVEQKLSGYSHVMQVNDDAVRKYSRRSQTRLIANLLNEID